LITLLKAVRMTMRLLHSWWQYHPYICPHCTTQMMVRG